MGRVKPSKLTGKFSLRTDRGPNKDGKRAVYIGYTIGAKRAWSETGVWVEERYWDDSKKAVSGKHPQSRRLNKQLEAKRNQIDDEIYNYTESGRLLTINVLRDIVQGKHNGVSRKSDFLEYATKVIEDKYKTGKFGVSVRDNALCSFNMFRIFLRDTKGKDSISISDLSPELVQGYIDWRKEKRENKNETINKTLTPIIKVARSAVIDKLLDSSVAEVLQGMYLPVKVELGDEDEDEKVNYLTEEQMRDFIGLYDKVKYPRTKDFMDMFLFSFNACGLRVSDIITLEWRNVDLGNRVITKILFKGNVKHTIPLNDDAMKILESWKAKTKDKGERFVFGLLPNDFDLKDKEECKRQRINKNTAIKTSLKHLGNKLGLPFNLTMHVARHTFAVWALNKRDVDVYTISDLLGHRSVQVTEQVYAKFMPQTKEKVVHDKLNFNLLK